MQVKIFDEESEKDLEFNLNNYLKNNPHDIVDIKFSTSCSIFGEDQIYCFSAMVLYKWKNG